MGEGRDVTYREIHELTRRVVEGFDRVERRSWSIEATMIELMKQVGDLSRHVMMQEEYYLPDREDEPEYRTDRARIGNELADVLYCLIRIADHYEIDLAGAALDARRAELRYLEGKAGGSQ